MNNNNQDIDEVITVNLADLVHVVRATHGLQTINIVGTSIAKLFAMKSVHETDLDSHTIDECMKGVNDILKNMTENAVKVLRTEEAKSVPDINMTSIKVDIPVSRIL